MKLANYSLPLLAVVAQCGAFVVQPTPLVVSTDRQFALGMAYDMVPELEGGEDMTPSSSLPGCRMKKMEALPDIRSDVGPVYKFWLTAEADGKLIKEYRTQLLKDASKKANFPGFRKGQVPPWAQPQITNFAVQESIVKTVEAAVVAFGITSLSGTEGNVEVNEDVSQMSKGYKEGTSLQFTATLNCALAEVKAAPVIDDEVEATSDVVDMADVVDVEATPVSEE